MKFENFGTPHESQRGYFAASLYEEMLKNKDIWLIMADLGYKMFDKHRIAFPERTLNTGAAEQTAVGIAVGLAQEGKIPFVYSITPFLLYRPLEFIRNYINHERTPVKLVGSGRGQDYSHDGFSHWAEEDGQIIRVFTNIIPFWPSLKEAVPPLVREMANRKEPFYLNLTR